MRLAAIGFWASSALLAFTHAGYPLALRALLAARGESPRPSGRDDAGGSEAELPPVSLIVAAHDEEAVIEAWVAAALALDYPRELLEVIVASDGSADRTAEFAGEAGADLVVELPRGGKVRALNAAVERSRGAILAFSDANAVWEPCALRRLVARFADERVAYVCGQVGFDGSGGENQEGLYWRYEMAVRELESRLAGVTAGNGAINAVRRSDYIFLEPDRGQDISFPYELTKRGRRAVYEPAALAREPMAATIGDEFGRKRRMMTGAWNTLLRHGMASPRGYPPLYAFQIASHRLLRYASPLLHLVALATNVALLRRGRIYALALGTQAALLAAAGLAGGSRLRLLRIARYYVAVTASSAAGLWDAIRGRVPTTWEKAGGTR